MNNQELINYIHQQMSQGISKDIITSTLINSGWQKDVIGQAFNSLYPPTSQTYASANIITEKDYPIQKRWVIKSFFGTPFAIIYMAFIMYPGKRMEYILIEFIFIFLIIGINVIFFILHWKNFHYSIENKFIIVRQGVISKKQRNLPYGVVQNVFVKQGLLDRLFRLSSLSIENASQGAGNGIKNIFGITLSGKNQTEAIGSSGNKVSIPGLNKQDAETLKNIILQKMKENPIEDSQSGL